MQTKLITAAAVTALALSVAPALAQNQKADRASQSFIKTAIEGNLAEIDVGKLAQEKGQSQAVKDFGAMLVQDHSDANQKAQAAANQIGVKPPSGSSFGEKATYAKLKMLSGASFDKSFAKSMVSDHQSDIKEYQKESTKSDAAGQYAKEALPTLQKHLQAAQRMQQQVMSEGKANSTTTGSNNMGK
ncbi:MAG: DUF4142 domain-containing protein [Pseudolabrys sp.]|nr:DUF4142 domain-containing protein [Pseudolabrys sp.]